MTDTLDSTHRRSDSGEIIENNRKHSSNPERPFLQLNTNVRELLTETLVNVTMSHKPHAVHIADVGHHPHGGGSGAKHPPEKEI